MASGSNTSVALEKLHKTFRSLITLIPLLTVINGGHPGLRNPNALTPRKIKPFNNTSDKPLLSRVLINALAIIFVRDTEVVALVSSRSDSSTGNIQVSVLENPDKAHCYFQNSSTNTFYTLVPKGISHLPELTRLESYNFDLRYFWFFLRGFV